MNLKMSPEGLHRINVKLRELFIAGSPLVERDHRFQGHWEQLRIAVPKGPYKRRRIKRLLERWAKG